VSNESSDVSVIDIGAVREFLKEDLPDYMVPSAYVLVEKWPMTENGRLDRRALPPPDDLRADLSRSYVAPSGPMEEPLADIWKELLKNERIGIHDDFLESGGNSLMAFQLVSRIRDVFHVDLPLSSVFETPTIAEQATAIAHRMIQHEPATEIEAVLTQIEHLDDEELERLLETNRRK
jgi:acyl carrier protein